MHCCWGARVRGPASHRSLSSACTSTDCPEPRAQALQFCSRSLFVCLLNSSANSWSVATNGDDSSLLLTCTEGCAQSVTVHTVRWSNVPVRRRVEPQPSLVQQASDTRTGGSGQQSIVPLVRGSLRVSMHRTASLHAGTVHPRGMRPGTWPDRSHSTVSKPHAVPGKPTPAHAHTPAANLPASKTPDLPTSKTPDLTHET